MSDSLKNSDKTKVAIIGCGKVGMTAAYTLALEGFVRELVLLGRCRDEIMGEQLDLEHGMSFMSNTHVMATDNYQDLAETDVVVITAGAAQKPGDTRLDLADKNIAIIEDIIPRVVKYAPNAIILMVSNPVDVLTYKAYHLAGLPKGRVFGSGTVLDTARFRFHLSEFLKVNPRSIHAYIMGEHGDSSFPVISNATIGGQPLNTFSNFSQERVHEAFERAQTAAYKIIASKGATFYAIGVVITHIVKSIFGNARTILPVSIPLHGQYGLSGVSLSVPCIIGRGGVENILETKLSWEEKQDLQRSADTIKQYLK